MSGKCQGNLFFSRLGSCQGVLENVRELLKILELIPVTE